METAVITGAGGGLGAEVARLFGEVGVHVGICARDADALEAVADDVRAAGGSATAQRGDVRDEYDMERLMESTARDGGPIDCVVAAADVVHGPPGEMPMDGESYAAFDDHVRTNGRGVFATVREALPHLAPNARILVPSVRAARDPEPCHGTYAASRALGEAVARQFAADLDHPVGILDVGAPASGEATDAAPMVRWAATDAAAERLDGRVLDREDRDAAR